MSSRRQRLRDDPSQFGFLALMREFERSFPDKPRIGRNATLDDEIITPGQDPWLGFASTNITGYLEPEGRRPKVRTRFMGYFGSHGALPLNTTQEVYHWFNERDPAFVHFADIFATRFQQLFYRAWADSRAITQFDHPDDDRFKSYLAAFLGLSSAPMQDRDSVPDIQKLPVVGLGSGRVKSAVRLRQILEHLLIVPIAIEEHVPMWLEFEAEDCSRIGQSGSALGRSTRLGARVQSVNEKIRIEISCETQAEYRSFLPGGFNYRRLADVVFWYLGPTIDVDIKPLLPATAVTPARLGGAGGEGPALGWTGWMGPVAAASEAKDRYIGNAVFSAQPQRNRGVEVRQT